jgi:hypothetical protein
VDHPLSEQPEESAEQVVVAEEEKRVDEQRSELRRVQTQKPESSQIHQSTPSSK